MYHLQEEEPTTSNGTSNSTCITNGLNGFNNHEIERLDAAWSKAQMDYDDNRVVDPLRSRANHKNHVTGRNGTNLHSRQTAGHDNCSYESVGVGLSLSSAATSSSLGRNTTNSTRLMNPPNSRKPNTSLSNSIRNAHNNHKGFISRYRQFLKKHEPLLSLLEHLMERFVFYGYLFKHGSHTLTGSSSSRSKMELYYASWNVLRLINDVILLGWGSGMGFTVGSREDWLPVTRGDGAVSSPSPLSSSRSLQSWLSLSTLSELGVPLLRTILTATSCIYPAMEAWERRLPGSSSGNFGYPLLQMHDFGEAHTSPNQSLQNIESIPNSQEYKYSASTTDPSPKVRRLLYERANCKGYKMVYALEKIKFGCRLILLIISWWARKRRREINQQHQLNQQQQQHQSNGSGKETCVPILLQRGGELDPYEQIIPLDVAEKEVQTVMYVGKRTGRRSVARGGTSSRSRVSISAGSTHRRSSSAATLAGSSNSISPTSAMKSFALLKWLKHLQHLLSKLSTISTNHKIIYLHAVAEVLHILRPLYWTNAQYLESKRRLTCSPSSSLFYYSFRIWKAWCLSLVMDLVSDRLLNVQPESGNSGGIDQQQHHDLNQNNNAKKGKRPSFLSRKKRKSTISSTSGKMTSVQIANQNEIEYRQSRHMMYLLRSPMYDTITRPMVVKLVQLIRIVPLFGLGRLVNWAMEYALDVMNYWNENSFMLES